MSNINESIFEINLDLIEQNINYLKKELNPNTQIIAVVKAYAYGHGDVEISKYLEKINIDIDELIKNENGNIKKFILNLSKPLKEYELSILFFNNSKYLFFLERHRYRQIERYPQHLGYTL